VKASTTTSAELRVRRPSTLSSTACCIAANRRPTGSAAFHPAEKVHTIAPGGIGARSVGKAMASS
jgi:hypothetical protein